jgi:hypothetical protein
VQPERDIQDDMLGHLSTVISQMKEMLIDMNTEIQWYVVVFRSRFEVALIRFCLQHTLDFCLCTSK